MHTESQNRYQNLSLLMQMLMIILKSIYMNKEKVNTHFHSTALIAYIAFLENLAGLDQTMYLMMKMFNLEVVKNIFIFIYYFLFLVY